MALPTPPPGPEPPAQPPRPDPDRWRSSWQRQALNVLAIIAAMIAFTYFFVLRNPWGL